MTHVGKVYDDTAHQLFDDAYRNPHRFGFNWSVSFTIGDAIRGLTGYRVVHEKDLHRISEGDWSANAKNVYDLRDTLRPAYSSSYTTWYYKRDVVQALLPRWTCSECGWRASRDRPRPKGIRCTKRCDRFLASPLWSRLNHKEQRRYWGHMIAPACSQECHWKAHIRYRRLTLDLWETRQWIAQGTELLVEVRSHLPPKYHRRGRRPKA